MPHIFQRFKFAWRDLERPGETWRDLERIGKPQIYIPRKLDAEAVCNRKLFY
jgi:hypothetical protein